MKRKEQINLLKKYKEALIYGTGYQTEEQKKQQELINKEPQKVKVLKKKLNGRYVNVI